MAKLTREEALRKHREMWTAMQKKLGDNPCLDDREQFKEDWCKEHGDDMMLCCYLCQYDEDRYGSSDDRDCSERCLIKWGGRDGCCHGDVNYMDSPIYEILALPEREVSE